MSEEESNSTAEDIWASCKLGRKKEALKLERFLIRIHDEKVRKGDDSSHTLNIDAKWGEGKTHFLNLWRKQLEQNHLVVSLDAWATDYCDDPLLALFNVFDESLNEFKGKHDKLTQVIDGVLSGIKKSYSLFEYVVAKRVFRGDKDNLKEASATSAEKMLEEFSGQGKVINELSSGLQDLVKAIGKDRGADYYSPIFIIIDELDRCRPLYAISLLERIKHLFNVAGIQFVIATDTEQLEHTVKSVYGVGFDARRYLKRFFDVQYHFPELLGMKHVKYLFDEKRSDIKNYLYIPLKDDDLIESIFCDFSDMFGWSMRDRIQIFEQLEHVAHFEFLEDGLHLIPMLFFIGLKRLMSFEKFDQIDGMASVQEIVEYAELHDVFPQSLEDAGLMYQVRKYRVGGGGSLVRVNRIMLINTYLKFSGMSEEDVVSQGGYAKYLYEDELSRKMTKDSNCLHLNNNINIPIKDYPRLIVSVGDGRGLMSETD